MVVAVGATVTLPPLKLPGCHTYVVAPDAVSVVLLPEQILPPPAAVTVGGGLTATVNVPVLVQPPLVPVTVYVVLDVGETTTLLPVMLPGIQV